METERSVRIIVQRTHQPPIDTPAAITHHTVVVKSEELAKLLADGDRYTTARIIGGHIEDECR